ncbi:hypothetical protein BJY52DRAFT_1196233 [Lactarius psammicola]|nr:hypothetical protein BJY52DRAFT_1196233 [Lactarius psammicola]
MARMCAYERQQFSHPSLPHPTILLSLPTHPTLSPYNLIIASMTPIFFLLLLVSWWLCVNVTFDDTAGRVAFKRVWYDAENMRVRKLQLTLSFESRADDGQAARDDEQ